MFGGNLGQGGRGCNHESQSNERPGVKIEDGAHVRVSLPKLVCKIMRVGISRESGHDTSEDEQVAEYRMVGWHRLSEESGLLHVGAPVHLQNLAFPI